MIKIVDTMTDLNVILTPLNENYVTHYAVLFDLRNILLTNFSFG